MKYKRIPSAIHNFGHSFLSFNNYVDGADVVDELSEILRAGASVELDWLARDFEPRSMLTERIRKSVGYWADALPGHLRAEGVEPERIVSLRLRWDRGHSALMEAVDDRGRRYVVSIRPR